jgi:ABC-type phosphate/phosphonate transport system substrate-binding protein
MNRTTIALSLIAVIALAGCTTSYRETLEQKLAGKSPNERQTILAQECGQEIQKGLKPKDEANVRHFEKMKKICEEMTGKPVKVQGIK